MNRLTISLDKELLTLEGEHGICSLPVDHLSTALRAELVKLTGWDMSEFFYPGSLLLCKVTRVTVHPLSSVYLAYLSDFHIKELV